MRVTRVNSAPRSKRTYDRIWPSEFLEKLKLPLVNAKLHFVNHFQFRTSLGTIGLTWNAIGKLSRVDWYSTLSSGADMSPAPRLDLNLQGFPPAIARVVTQMHAYFSAGEPITDLSWDVLELSQLSDFQKRVFEATMKIPHGETRTYSWVAAHIKSYAATRAVGQALRRNPFPILIPCHRVVAANALGGFMGRDDPEQPELQLKNRLIQLEESYRSPLFSFLTAPLSSPSWESSVSIGLTG